MTAEEIKQAVRDGKLVRWSNSGYVVEYDKVKEDFDIVCTSNNHRIGLTWQDGVTLNGKEEQFYID